MAFHKMLNCIKNAQDKTDMRSNDMPIPKQSNSNPIRIQSNPIPIPKRSNPLDNMRTPLLSTRRKTSDKVFYVCSFGGCGSKMLCEYLQQFGTVKHVHSRYPPSSLTEIDEKTEWFSQIPIKATDLPNYYVLYIYRDPVKAILSRFTHPAHLAHIQSNPAITLPQVLSSKQDLYGITNFFDNYTSPSANRNYKIYCVKYEDFFYKVSEFNQVFQLPSEKAHYPVEKTTNKPFNIDVITLQEIYAPLNERMRQMPFIKIV